jgi:Family of unknown function (DUF5681)
MKKKRQPSDKAWQAPARAQNPELPCENSSKKRLGGITGKGFIPGQSGNPGGRPKGSVKVSSCYERALARPFPGDQQGRTYAQVIADRTVELAAEGRIDAIKEITDRTEGRSKQTIDVSRSDLRKEYLKKTVDDLCAKYGKPRDEVMGDLMDLDPTASEFLM